MTPISCQRQKQNDATTRTFKIFDVRLPDFVCGMARGTLRVLLCQEEFEYADDNNLSDWEEFGRSTHIFPVSTDKSNLSPIDKNIHASFFYCYKTL